MDSVVFTTIASIVALFASMLGIYISVSGHKRSERRDSAQIGRETGAILAEIGYIKSGVDDIKREQREQAKTNIELFTRLSAVEASSKQAHRRLDELKGT